MKVLVTVAEVAEVEDKFEVSDDEIAEQYLTYDLNEWDDYAVEEAVQLSEEEEDVEVITATIGPERSEETIRMTLAKGADRAVRVWDEAIESADYLDINSKADLLAAVVEEENPDLVLSGVQSGDKANGATGVSLAQKIGFEWGAVVNKLELDVDGGVATVHRELEGGVEEVTDIETPAVLTIQSGINEPRYASLRGIRQAQRKPLDVQTLEDISLDADVVESPLAQTSMYKPESESDTTMWTGSPEDEAAQLADLLRNKGVVDA
ncbi:electron transfer flavoprotein beta subunit [Halogranum rubrum]|uniref:Electron transfer flavoprotein beta subunit n=1 Tax=Halogranum rubrum TaxID=553466 RepID=A0A1I4HSF4_9EURY|nr:electron transfer flavoprotein subunit beta/FixA family protein [Halogranum rubrum]SFL45198.1 electron transfer flavoprotein beta subunit [Halogranum rubrum]